MFLVVLAYFNASFVLFYMNFIGGLLSGPWTSGLEPLH